MDAINIFRGFCMGVADTVPGVSGGTIALILGHYDRLIASIRHIDREAVSHLQSRRWFDFAKRIDARFLLAIAAGMVMGAGALAGLMHWLLEHRLNETMAVFFGLVLASVWVVRGNVAVWRADRWVAAAAGTIVALAISQIPMSSGEVGYGFLFGSASIAICAMILPGISGAFILLLLGVYEPVIGMIKGFVKGDVTVDVILRLSIFSAGCLTGLLVFSRLLHYLLRHHRDATMASLIGLMIGSVGRLWPLQIVTPETADLELKYRQFQFVSPGHYPGSVLILLGLAIAAAVAVLAVNAIASRQQSVSDQG